MSRIIIQCNHKKHLDLIIIKTGNLETFGATSSNKSDAKASAEPKQIDILSESNVLTVF